MAFGERARPAVETGVSYFGDSPLNSEFLTVWLFVHFGQREGRHMHAGGLTCLDRSAAFRYHHHHWQSLKHGSR